MGPKIIGPHVHRQFLFSVAYEPRTLANDHIISFMIMPSIPSSLYAKSFRFQATFVLVLLMK